MSRSQTRLLRLYLGATSSPPGETVVHRSGQVTDEARDRERREDHQEKEARRRSAEARSMGEVAGDGSELCDPALGRERARSSEAGPAELSPTLPVRAAPLIRSGPSAAALSHRAHGEIVTDHSWSRPASHCPEPSTVPQFGLRQSPGVNTELMAGSSPSPLRRADMFTG